MLVADLAPSRVILLTALASIADGEKYPGLARALNTDFPGRVAGACAKIGARLVHVSTDLVFGAVAPGENGFSERDTPAPVSNYGRTKLAGERAVLAALPSALVVRLPLCWDEDGRGAGASTPLVAAVRAGERPGLFTDEWRTPLFAADAGELLVRCAWLEAEGLLHVAGAERITRYDLGLSLLVARGFALEEARARVRAVTRADAGMDALRPGDVCLDATLARERHGLAPRGVSACLRALANAQVPA
jgi:dTDP-4-dehydrorhamnose reductase